MNTTETILRAAYEEVGAPVGERALPVLRVSMSTGGSWTFEECRHDVFAFLCDAVRYDADADRALLAFRGSVDEFCGSIGGQGFWVNSYSDETDMLSGVLRYFAAEGSDLRLLQVHGRGCETGLFRAESVSRSQGWALQEWAGLPLRIRQTSRVPGMVHDERRGNVAFNRRRLQTVERLPSDHGPNAKRQGRDLRE